MGGHCRRAIGRREALNISSAADLDFQPIGPAAFVPAESAEGRPILDFNHQVACHDRHNKPAPPVFVTKVQVSPEGMTWPDDTDPLLQKRR